MTKQNESQRAKSWTHRSDNRERLIAAGYTVLAEKGYEATTVKEVARVAGRVSWPLPLLLRLQG